MESNDTAEEPQGPSATAWLLQQLDDIPDFAVARFGPTFEDWKSFMRVFAVEREGGFSLQDFAELWWKALESHRKRFGTSEEQDILERIKMAQGEGYTEGLEEGMGQKFEWEMFHRDAVVQCEPQTLSFRSIEIQTTIDTSPPSLTAPTHTTSVQAEISSPVPTFSNSVTLPPKTSINWADDAQSIPVTRLISPQSSLPSPRRDISCLHSSSVKKPFGSLQRRFTQGVRIFENSRKSSNHRYVHSMLPHRRQQASQSSSHPNLSQFSPKQSRSSPHSRPPSHSNPRYQSEFRVNMFVLSDIARALGQMGWRPPRLFQRRF
jgi:hypothetical protein